MRIGMMLRSIDEMGGIGVYTDNLVREVLDLDSDNQYFLFYRSVEKMGRFAARANVTERHLRAPSKALWDQLAVPLACLRYGVDVVFHPKFTVPLFASCKTVMVVHGADWLLPDQAQFYSALSVVYSRAVMPLYFRKASRVISVSRLTTDNFRRALKVPEGKIETVYFGPARHFSPVTDTQVLAEVRQRLDLPARYILTLTKLGDRNRKNFAGVLRGYQQYHGDSTDPLPLVVAGKDCDTLRGTFGIPSRGYGRDVRFPGWIDQRDLPAVYSMAELLLYPSNLEAFPIPLTEAMACGTPMVTSKVNGLEEIAGDAAVLVDPSRPTEIAEALVRVAADPEFRTSLSQRALSRSKLFSWRKCAEETLAVLESLGGSGSNGES